jgi:AcrR family transcriptional regulator
MAKVRVGARLSLRAERAQVTHRRIVAAARSLFAERGYGATTLEAIAAEAGVAVQTVYAIFRSKSGILRALRESVLRQPEAEALFERAISEPAAAVRLELFAASIRNRWEHGHDIVAIDMEAGRTEPAIRQESVRVVAVRRKGLALLAKSMRGQLAPGIDVASASAILDALTLPEVYRELVSVHGWKAGQFEVWLAEVLKQQLLGGPSRTAPRAGPRTVHRD